MSICFYRCSMLNWNHTAAPVPLGRSGVRYRMRRDFGMQHLPLYPRRVHTRCSPPLLLGSEQHYNHCHRLFFFPLEDMVFDKHLPWVVFFELSFRHGVVAQKRARWNVWTSLWGGEENGRGWCNCTFPPLFDCRGKAGCGSTPCFM